MRSGKSTRSPNCRNCTLGIFATRDFFHEVQDSIIAHGVNFPFAVVDRTHDAFAGVRKGVYLVVNNTDLTILERLEFLDQTQKGPSDITSTDVHGKVLEILHWAEGDEGGNGDFSLARLLPLQILSTGARLAFGNLVGGSVEVHFHGYGLS